MQEIKELLESGKTVKELIELDYKKPSIYKVKKKMKEDNQEKIVTGNKEKESSDNSNKLSFQEENNPLPEKTLESPPKVDDNNPAESDNPVSDHSDAPVDEKKEEAESIIPEETFEDDAAPFRQFDGINIRRDNIDVTPITNNVTIPDKTNTKEKSGSVGVTELLTEVFGTIGILTGHDFWDLSKKDQKILKHLCKLPGLEKFLHKFGLYGCVFSLFTITFKRIKMEIKLKKIPDNVPEVQINPALPITGRTDIPTSILEAVPQ